MNFPTVGSSVEVAAASKVTEITAPASTTSSSTAAAAGTPQTDLESAILGPALAQIQELPEVDQTQVATLRSSIERGEIPFDASKLAALIQRYHRTGQ
jgi:negative regulator of flagellin synthesis FlgM